MHNVYIYFLYSILTVATITFGQLPRRQEPLKPGIIASPLSDKIIAGAEYLELANDKLDLVGQGIQFMYDKITENSGVINYAHSQAKEALSKITKIQDDIEANTLTKSLAKDIKDPIYAALNALAEPGKGALPSLISVLEQVQYAFDGCKKEKESSLKLLNNQIDAAKKSITRTDISKRTLPKRLKDLASVINAFGQ
ncbi:MAG TPA: hypothetical protein PKD74_01685 [Candidatus Dependentiae bacterium]|jgi:hypothetical protein|nr:hypothetical protein [Candidatus Dependentiae bacterium]